MLINLLKCPILQCSGKWKSNPESVSGTGSPQKLTDSDDYGLTECAWLSRACVLLTASPCHADRVRNRLLVGRTHKGPFRATQLNSTQLDRRRQLSCVDEGVYSDASQLNSTSSWVDLRRYKRALRLSCLSGAMIVNEILYQNLMNRQYRLW